MVGPKYVSYVHKNYSLDQRRRHSQPKQTIKNKIRVPRVNYLLLHHHELTTTLSQTKTYHTKAVKEPTPVPETSVFTWTHVHTATSAKQQLLSTRPYCMILYYSTHQNHSCNTMVEPAAAASILAQLSPCTDPPLLSSLRRRRGEP